MLRMTHRLFSRQRVLAAMLVGSFALCSACRQRDTLYDNIDQRKFVTIAAIGATKADHVHAMLDDNRVPNRIEVGEKSWVKVPQLLKDRAHELLRSDAAKHGYKVHFTQ